MNSIKFPLLASLLLVSLTSLLAGDTNLPTPASANSAAGNKQTNPPITEPDGRKYLSTVSQNGKITGAEKLAKCAARVAQFKDKPCDLIFIGDSITELWLDQKRGGLPIWTQKYEPLHALNFGIGGDTVQNVLWRFENMDIKSLRPKVAVVMIGTNNKTHTTQEIADGVKAVISKTQATFPGVKIILVSIIPSNRVSGGSESLAFNDKMMAADAIIKAYADDKSVFWIDLVPMMPAVTTPTADGKQDLNFKGLSSDKIHPDGTGYQIWADAMDPLLTKLLSGN